MRKLFRKGLTVLLVLALLAGTGITALAVDSSLAITYEMTVSDAVDANGDSVTYDLSDSTATHNVCRVPEKGDIITVSFLVRSDSDFSLFSLQNEIVFDESFFEYISVSATPVHENADADKQQWLDGTNFVKSAFYKSNGSTFTGTGDTLCTFRLRLREDSQADRGVVSSSTMKATEYISTSDQRKITNITAKDLEVIVGNAPSNMYTVTFDPGEGTMNVVPPTSYAEGSVIEHLPEATRAGYSLRWSDGNGNTYAPGESYTVNGDVTFTAVWSVRTYALTLDLNGGELAANYTSPAGAYTSGTQVQLPDASQVRRAGYVLTGWQQSSDRLDPGAEYTVTGAVTLIAQWQDHSSAHATLAAADKIYVERENARRYAHIEGSQTHTTTHTHSVTCAICGATLPDETTTTTDPCVGVQYSGGRNSLTGWIYNTAGTQRWHECAYCGVFDRENVTPVVPEPGTGTGGTGGTGGGESGGGESGTVTIIRGGNTGGTVPEPTVNISEEEVPLSDASALVTARLLQPIPGATATASRNNDGSITVVVRDADGSVMSKVPGGVLVTDFGATTGQVVVITDPATGEILDLVEKSLVEGQVAYTLLDGSVTIRIIDNAKPFDDVMPYDWFNDSVIFASSHELFNGTAERIFEPNTPMSRGMLVTVLWRLENKPDDFSENVFSDVENGTWYTDPVRWATKNGIVKGYDDGTFRPNKEITREEMAAILYRYMNYLQYNVTGRNDLSAYTDASGVAQWALENVQWAVDAGVITGVTADTIQPQTTATRAQVATMFQRIVTGMVK